MTWPDDASVASYDKTALTWGVNVDSKLWPALTSKSPLLDRVKRFPVDEIQFSWETDNMPARTYVNAAAATSIEDGSGAEVTATFTSGTPIQKGSIMKNVTRATPIGTYGADELIEITANAAGVCSIVRDVGRQNSGTGSTAHTEGDTFQIVYAPKEEGSSISRHSSAWQCFDSVAKNEVIYQGLFIYLACVQERRRRLRRCSVLGG